jgi:hypothetical protein
MPSVAPLVQAVRAPAYVGNDPVNNVDPLGLMGMVGGNCNDGNFCLAAPSDGGGSGGDGAGEVAPATVPGERPCPPPDCFVAAEIDQGLIYMGINVFPKRMPQFNPNVAADIGTKVGEAVVTAQRSCPPTASCVNPDDSTRVAELTVVSNSWRDARCTAIGHRCLESIRIPNPDDRKMCRDLEELCNDAIVSTRDRFIASGGEHVVILIDPVTKIQVIVINGIPLDRVGRTFRPIPLH